MSIGKLPVGLIVMRVFAALIVALNAMTAPLELPLRSVITAFALVFVNVPPNDVERIGSENVSSMLIARFRVCAFALGLRPTTVGGVVSTGAATVNLL